MRSAAAADSGDDLSNLRKLLKEGRIAGLNERPPAFKPPSPPTAKPGKEKPRPTATTEKQTRQDKRPTGEAGEKRGKRVAPPPPESGKEVMDGGRKVRGGGDGDVDLKPPAPAGGVKFLGGRRVHSVENLCGRGGEVGRDPALVADQPTDPLKRSTSMHTHQGADNHMFILFFICFILLFSQVLLSISRRWWPSQDPQGLRSGSTDRGLY